MPQTEIDRESEHISAAAQVLAAAFRDAPSIAMSIRRTRLLGQ